MLTLEDIQSFIYGLGLAEPGSVYIGKLDNKKEESIGVYSRRADGPPVMALGGYACSSYAIRRISLLVHWNRDKAESEDAAVRLYQKLLTQSCLMVGTTFISCLALQVPEPQDVGTDENGVYEYVIWVDFIYQKEQERKEVQDERESISGT